MPEGSRRRGREGSELKFSRFQSSSAALLNASQGKQSTVCAILPNITSNSLN